MTGAELVTAVLDQGGFDVDRSDGLAWVNEAYRKMVARSLWRKAERTLGVTVAGEGSYDLADEVVDVADLSVTTSEGESVYDRKSVTDIWNFRTGRSSVDGPVFAPSYDTDGAQAVQLWPVPAEADALIKGLVALQPTPLEDSGISVPIIPDDLHEHLRDGAISTGLRLIEETIAEADNYEARFREGIEQLRLRANSRVGSGATQIKVHGYHFR